jgi:hypothetical protein
MDRDDALPVPQGRVKELEREVVFIRKQLDTLGSPWWKRLWYRIDGWPPWYVVATKRAWRPWHKKS